MDMFDWGEAPVVDLGSMPIDLLMVMFDEDEGERRLPEVVVTPPHVDGGGVFEFGFGQIFSTINELANALRAEFYDIAAYLHDAQGRGEEGFNPAPEEKVIAELTEELRHRDQQLKDAKIELSLEQYIRICNATGKTLFGLVGAAVGGFHSGGVGAGAGFAAGERSWEYGLDSWYCEEVWNRHYKP